MTIGQLSPTRQRVLALIAQGKSNKVIARELGISPGTARNHITAIMRKLGLDNRVLLALAWHGVTLNEQRDSHE